MPVPDPDLGPTLTRVFRPTSLPPPLTRRSLSRPIPRGGSRGHMTGAEAGGGAAGRRPTRSSSRRGGAATGKRPGAESCRRSCSTCTSCRTRTWSRSERSCTGLAVGAWKAGPRLGPPPPWVSGGGRTNYFDERLGGADRTRRRSGKGEGAWSRVCIRSGGAVPVSDNLSVPPDLSRIAARRKVCQFDYSQRERQVPRE